MALYGDSHKHNEVSFYVVTICIVFCTTLTLCLVFVPKVCLFSILFLFDFFFWSICKFLIIKIDFQAFARTRLQRCNTFPNVKRYSKV